MTRNSRWYDNLLLNAYWFGLSFMWNGLHPILLPVILLGFADETKNTLYGLLTFVGLLVALVTQPLSGALSDYTRHHLGRRRPWMLLGALLTGGWLLVLALAERYWLVGVAYLMMQLCSNLAHGPAQGLIPDLVAPGRRGVAVGVKNVLDMLGIVAAAVVVGRVMGSVSPQPIRAAMLITLALWGSLAITAVGIREHNTLKDPFVSTEGISALLRRALRVDLQAHSNYARLLLARFFVLFSSYAVQSFALYYFHDVLHIDTPARAVGDIMTVIGLSVLAVVYPAGALSERWGRKGLSLIACAIVSLGIGLLALTHNAQLLWLWGLLIGVGMGIFSSVNWAWATDLAPAAEAGKYLGLSNLATAGSAATARLLGPIIDLVNRGAPAMGYSLVFALAALSSCIGFMVILGIPTPQKRLTCDAEVSFTGH